MIAKVALLSTCTNIDTRPTWLIISDQVLYERSKVRGRYHYIISVMRSVCNTELQCVALSKYATFILRSLFPQSLPQRTELREFIESKDLYPNDITLHFSPSFCRQIVAVPVPYPIAVTVAGWRCKVWWEFLWQSFGPLICHLH